MARRAVSAAEMYGAFTPRLLSNDAERLVWRKHERIALSYFARTGCQDWSTRLMDGLVVTFTWKKDRDGRTLLIYGPSGERVGAAAWEPKNIREWQA